MRKEAEIWIDNLSEMERTAIQKYTYNSGDQKPNRFFERLNRMLRGASKEEKKLRMYADSISDALKRSSLKHDVICYRTVTLNPFTSNKAGDIVRPKQFFSTSVIEDGVLKNGNCKITIYAKRGTHAGYIEQLSKFKSQHELLLDKDNLYRVLSIKESEVVLEVI